MNKKFQKVLLLALMLMAILLSVSQGTKVNGQPNAEIVPNSMLQILIDNSGSMACDTDNVCPANNPIKSKLAVAKNKVSDWAWGKKFDGNLKPEKIRVIELTGKASNDDLGTLCKVNASKDVWNLNNNKPGAAANGSIDDLLTNMMPDANATSPITLALINAVEFYSNSGSKGSLKVILISDGGSNCDKTEEKNASFKDRTQKLQEALKAIPTPCDYINQQIEAKVLAKGSFFFQYITEKQNAEEIKKTSAICLQKLNKDFSTLLVNDYGEIGEQLEKNAGGDWLKEGNTQKGNICSGNYFICSLDNPLALVVISLLAVILFSAKKNLKTSIRTVLGSIMISIGEGLLKAGDTLKKEGEEFKKMP